MYQNFVRRIIALGIALIMMVVPMTAGTFDNIWAVAVAEETEVNDNTASEQSEAPTEAPTAAPTEDVTAVAGLMKTKMLGLNNTDDQDSLTSTQAADNSRIYVPVEIGKVVNVTGKPVDTNATYLKWDVVSGADGYQIVRSTTYNGTYSFLKNVDVNEARNYSLTPGGTYYYKVRAYRLDETGAKVFGEESEIVEISVLGTCDNFDVYAVDTNASKLVWDAVDNATGYQVFRTVAGSGEYVWVKNNSTAGVNNYSLTPGTTYYYKIRAYIDLPDGTRAYGQFTDGMKVHILGEIKNLTINTNTNTISLDWSDVSNVTGYQVFYTIAGTGGEYAWTKNVTASQAQVANLLSNTDYYYKIRAYVDQPNGIRAYGQFSNAVHKVTGMAAPQVDAYSSTDPAPHEAGAICFMPIQGNVTGYNIYRKESGGSWSKVYSGSEASFSTDGTYLYYCDYSVIPNKTYYYTVQAYASGKTSTLGADVASFSTKIGTPSMLEARGGNSSENNFYLSFSDTPGIDKREVQYSTSSSSGFKNLVSLTENSPGDHSSTYYDGVTSLSAGKVYYFRVRNVYEKNGNKYYSSWSSSISGVIPNVKFLSDTPTGQRYLVYSDIYNYSDVPITLSHYGLFYGTSSGNSYLIELYDTSGSKTISSGYMVSQTWDYSQYSYVYAYSTNKFFNTFYCNGYEYGIQYNSSSYYWAYVD